MFEKKIVYWIPLFALLFFSFYKSLSFPLHDFGNYYFGSYYFIKGQFGSSLYEALVFNQKISADGYNGLFLSYAPNPPITSLLFLPFTFLPPASAKLIFNLLGIALFTLSWIRLCNHLKLQNRYCELLPLIFALPIYNNILFGQVYFILFVLLVEGYLALQKGQTISCALLWGIAIIFKITPGILLLYLFFRKKYKPLLLVLSACTALLVLSIFLNGWEVWCFYITEILPKANQGDATSAAFTINYQSAYMVLKYLFVQDALDNPAPIINNPVIFQLCVLVFKVLVITFAASYTNHSKSDLSSWAVWIVASLLVSPYGSTYTYIILIIPLITIVLENKKILFIALLFIIFINMPVTLLYDRPLYLQFPRFYLTLVIFILLLAHETFTLNRQLILPLILITILLGISTVISFRSPVDSSSYLLRTHNHPLVVSYELEDGLIKYHYWTPNGVVEQNTEVKAASLSFDSIHVADNQIVYKGKKIGPRDKDKKIQPSVLNDSTVVYLSNKGRGYGFYSFRKFSLNR